MSDNIRSTIDKILPWSVLGLIATVILGVPGIYFASREKSPEVVFEVVSESNVLDIHKPLKDLSISFRGQDLQEKQQNLRIITVAVSNRGELSIKQPDFDQQKPWGLAVRNAEIIEQPRLISASSEYIRDNLHPKTSKDNDSVEFNKIIFEKGKSFTIELRVLHSADKEPQLVPLGKIAGLDKQVVIRNTGAEKEPSFWGQVFSGGMGIQATRTGIYFVGTIFLLLVVAGTSVTIGEKRHKQKRRRREQQTTEYLQPLLDGRNEREKEVIWKLFKDSDGMIKKLARLQNVLSDGETLGIVNDIRNSCRKLPTDKPSGFFSVRSRIPGFMFENYESGASIRVNPTTATVLAEMVEFMIARPVPDNLVGRWGPVRPYLRYSLDSNGDSVFDLSTGRMEGRSAHPAEPSK